MRVEVAGMIFIAAMMLVPWIALADAVTAPSLCCAIPLNGSYVPGGNRDFYVGVTGSDLDAAEVALHIKSVEAEDWDEYSMACAVINATDWNCTATVSLNIVGSDTTEMYYFEANDTSGNEGALGDVLHPLIFIVDINRPVIDFLNPANNTYVAGVEVLSLQVTDASSGVENSSVAYSTDNSSWSPMTSAGGTNYNASWSTLALLNNQSVQLYAKATDKIGNTGYAWRNVTVDNEYPTATISKPSAGQTLSGVAEMEVNASDSHSGIKTTEAYVTIGGTRRTMTCAKSGSVWVCDDYFDTATVTDGPYTVAFSISDNAGNSVSPFVSVTTFNQETRISIGGLAAGSYLRGMALLNASVANPLGQVTGVQLKITGSSASTAGYSYSTNMACSADYSSCQTSWDTLQVTDGQYTISVNATNTAGKLVQSSVSIISDNTQPLLAIDSPATSVVSGTIYPKMVVTDDYGVADGSAVFTISDYSYVMTCSIYVSGKKYVCAGNFDTLAVGDEYYTLYFYASDLAGNANSASKVLLVDNFENVGPSPPSNITTIITVPVYASTTTLEGQPAAATTTTMPVSALQQWIESPENPVSVLVWNAQKAFDNTFNTWPLKAFAISMIVFLIILAVFSTSQVRRLLERKVDIIET